jgi:hypothetical protein
MDEFDDWYANTLTYAPGEVIRVQDAFDAFRATLDPIQRKAWVFHRMLAKLAGLTGRLDPRGPLLIANVAFARKHLVTDDDGILREVG